MERSIVDPQRVRILREGNPGTGPVCYWMSRDQRLRDNWALLYAQQQALLLRRPLAVVFCLDPGYPGANLRHFGFLLRGVHLLHEDLRAFHIPLILLEGDPRHTLPAFFQAAAPALLVTDFDPLRIKRQWITAVYRSCPVPVVQVDAHNIVPCWLASNKREYGAYTLRPKIRMLLDRFLTNFPLLEPHPFPIAPSQVPSIEQLLGRVADTGVGEISWLQPGEQAAHSVLNQFLGAGLTSYNLDRNNPCHDGQSNLSPYLHFGQLAPQRAAWEVLHSSAPQEAKDAFLEELIIRRELSNNFCLYEEHYDRFQGFSAWARTTLEAHRYDPRPYHLDLQDLKNCRSPEPFWNKCQHDLMVKGKLHGYLRMYWAKKILEWSASPEEALARAIHLNDTYSLDGRDPNGYAGIAWSIGGVHDRPWPERTIYGQIRSMTEKGCRKKFDVAGSVGKQASMFSPPEKARWPFG